MHSQSPLYHALALAGSLTALSVGCGSDDDGPSPGASVMDASLDGGADAGAPAKTGPLVIVTEQESGQDVRLAYLHVLHDWPADKKLDHGKAAEIGDKVSVSSFDGAVFAYRPADGTLTKWVVDAQLRVRVDQTIGFGAFGVKGYDADNIWVSSERAFLVDEASGQIIRWNPKTMEIEGTTPIDPSLLKKGNLAVQFQQGGVISGGRAFMTARWRDWTANDYLDGLALAWFDTALDAPVVHLIQEDRCASSGGSVPFLDEGGNVYVSGDAALGYDALANTKKTTKPQCVRRVLAGKTEFDPDFFVDLQMATGSPGFRDVHGMPGQKVLLNLWAPDVNVADIATPGSAEWYWKYPPYFDYVIVDLVSKQPTRVMALPRAAAQFSLTLRVDGVNYVQTYRATDKGANIHRVDTTGNVTTVLDLGASNDVQYLGRL